MSASQINTQELATRKQAVNQELATVERQIAEARQQEKREIIERVKGLMRDHGLSLRDLRGGKPLAHGPKAGTKVPVKYRDANGNTWTGRGLRPKWIQQFIDKGGDLASIQVR